jgi:hypothetical protein
MTDRIYIATICNDTDGRLLSVDTIKHENKIWLVPRWLEVPALAVSMPARIIRFDDKQHQNPKSGSFGDFVINVPVPKVLLEPTTPKQPVPGWEYIELPEIEIPASVRPLRNPTSGKN